MKKANAPKKIKCVWIILLLLILLGAFGYGAYYFYFMPSNQGQLLEGILGLVYTNYVQIVISVFSIVIMAFVAGIILSHHKKEKRILRLLTLLVCLLPAGLITFFLLKEPLMDLVYISNPRMVLLSNVVLEKQNGQYDLSGTDQNGNIQTYRMNENTWNSLEQEWEDQKDIFAQVNILPKTQIVMDIHVDDHLSQSSIQKLVMENRLSDNWEDMQIQIDNMVYQLNEPLSSLTESGWTIQQSKYQAKKRENIDAGKTLELELENKNGLQMRVKVKNTTDQTIETSKASLVEITVHRMNQGMHMMLAKQIVLGWSQQSSIEKAYGEPKKEDKNQITYVSENKTLNLIVSKKNILDEIHMSIK